MSININTFFYYFNNNWEQKIRGLTNQRRVLVFCGVVLAGTNAAGDVSSDASAFLKAFLKHPCSVSPKGVCLLGLNNIYLITE
jgi:hypothetical protein